MAKVFEFFINSKFRYILYVNLLAIIINNL